MHLVFLNQYYPPDVAPTGVMLQAVVERLAEEGHRVTVICAAGGYAKGGGTIEHRTTNIERRSEEVCRGASATVADAPDSINNRQSTINNRQSPNAQPPHSIDSPALPGVRIVRIGATRFGRGTFVGKLLDYASYYCVGGWRLLTVQPKPDRIIALTTPPYLSVLARLVSKLRVADHAHWVMDLYPDVMVAHGMLAESGWKHRLLAGLARWGFGGGRCAAIVTLGPDMAERVGRLNIERRTPNIEHRSEETCSGAPATVADAPDLINNQQSTINNQSSPIHWVPLWGSEGVASRGDSEASCSGASATVVDISDPNNQQSTINNHQSPTCRPPSLRQGRGWADADFVVMYSGNMGLGHRFGEFLEAAGALNIEHRTSNIERRSEEICSGASATVAGISYPNHQLSTPNLQQSPGSQLSSSKTRFVFYGRGRRRGEIENFVREHPACGVELHDYAPAEDLTEHLQSADVHLASLDAAWSGTMVPSKLQGIFAVGRPVIFVGSAKSSIGRWITESGGGWVVAPEDGAGLAAALAEAGDPEIRKSRGDAAFAYARQHFDKATNAAQVARVFARQGPLITGRA